MSQHQPQESGQPSVSLPYAEPPVAPMSFFAKPTTTPTDGELMVPQQQLVPEQQPWPPSPQQPGLAAHQSAHPVSQQRQGLAGQDRAQLRRLCRHLRETDRCPGECVLSRARYNRRLRRLPSM